MERRRNTWEAAIRLAVTASLLAAVTAVALSTAGLPQPVIVLGVMVASFATSWIRTGHDTAPAPVRPVHRTVAVRVRDAHPVS